MLEVYHLHLGQSERVVWLLEEMQLPYTLKVFKRDPQTGLGPEGLKAVNPAGTAPYFRDTSSRPEIALSESTATVTYILQVYSGEAKGTRMIRTPEDADYAQYLEWYHYANGSLQASMLRQMSLLYANVDEETSKRYQQGLNKQLALIDAHLASNKWFSGNEISAADCMNMFSLSTMRGFCPLDLGSYPNILRWMRDVSARPAYQRAVSKADEGMAPMIEPRVRKFTQFERLREPLERVVF